jgi:hypothetical protein
MMVLLSLLVAIAAAGCVGPFSELKERRHPSASAARAADPSGWIPDILPPDATDIREPHTADSIRAWGCFSTRSADSVRALLGRNHAQPSVGPIGTRPAEIFRDFSWWPESMNAGPVEAWEFVEAAACATCGGRAVVRVGIDASSGTVCFHRTF